MAAPTPIPLSVLIRTRNEADRIAATIRSVLPLGAEIVVIDAESTDDTVKIAEALGAKVFVHAWPGFGPQRHWGEERCANDFIFSVDADEIVTPEMAAEIYLVSLVIIDEQNDREKIYLDTLADKLKLPPQLRMEIAQQLQQSGEQPLLAQ